MPDLRNIIIIIVVVVVVVCIVSDEKLQPSALFLMLHSGQTHPLGIPFNINCVLDYRK